MGKMFEALRKAEKERTHLLAKAGDDPSLLGGADGEIDPHLVAWYDRMSPITEQYRTLRENLRKLHPDSPPRVITITSSEPREGKTLTALNLAVTFCDDKDARVAVVDADLRRPCIHRVLGIDNQRGLSDFLAGNVMLELVLSRTRLPNLSVLPGGRLPSEPGELLSSKKMDDLVTRLSRDFQIVIVDTPALSTGTDAALVGAKTDGALLTVRIGGSPKAAAGRGIELLRTARVPVLGTVVTHLPPTIENFYYTPAPRRA